MSQTREVIPCILFNAQIVYSNRLFEAETKDMTGKPMDVPQYSCNLRFPKTKALWYEEPSLKPLVDACKVVMSREMAGVAFQYIEFPVKDGDRPNKLGKVPDWAAGHWVIRAGTGYAPKVEQLVNGAPSEIQALAIGGRKLWGDGDFVAASLGVAKRATDMVGIKAYLNGCCFTGKGAELKTSGPAVDWASAIREAQQQGIQIQQGAPQGGFGPQTGAQGGFGAQPGFGGPGPQPGFQPGPQSQQQGFQPGPQPQPGPGAAGASPQGFQPGFNPNPGGAPNAGFQPGPQQGFNPNQQGFGAQPGFGPGGAPSNDPDIPF